ncbi:hypothetical protein N0Y54_30330 [Nostoc punctiforme UO1]|uniref:hypothetical protein n=1 Tax=Nostoc punctiforme TaxID=272131 RepID=UPI0030B6852F
MNQFTEVGQYWLRGLRKGEGGAPRSKGFVVTGTTLKCAKDLNRRAVGIEITSSAQML